MRGDKKLSKKIEEIKNNEEKKIVKKEKEKDLKYQEFKIVGNEVEAVKEEDVDAIKESTTVRPISPDFKNKVINTKKITHETKALYLKEINELETKINKEILPAVADAKAFGDLSENAEYTAARESLGKAEQRKAEIKYILETHMIMDSFEKSNYNCEIVVTLNGKKQSFTLGSEADANAKRENKFIISDQSPVGSALLLAKAGETLNVKMGDKYTTINVLEIKQRKE